MTSAGKCTTRPHRACGELDRLVRLRPTTGAAAHDAEQRKASDGDGCSGERAKTLDDALYRVQEQGTVGIVPHHGRETAADIDVQGPLMTTVIDGCRFWKGRLKEATVSFRCYVWMQCMHGR
jgi:hypothetical protein